MKIPTSIRWVVLALIAAVALGAGAESEPDKIRRLEAENRMLRAQIAKAKVQLARMQKIAREAAKAAVIPPKPIALIKGAKYLTLDLAKGVTMKLAQIPAGSFLMGSPETEKGHKQNEAPQRKITISRPFFMGLTEVTQEQYEAVMGKGENRSKFKGPKNPADMVSWGDAVEFCKKLSAKTRRTVRLPTEAEWEYACRAGTKTRYSFGDDQKQLGDYAWYRENSDRKTHPVAQKKPNAWGLYDMHGNLWEWCSDWSTSYHVMTKTTVDPQGWASGSNRIMRGGALLNDALHARSAYRFGMGPVMRMWHYGFRVVVVVN